MTWGQRRTAPARHRPRRGRRRDSRGAAAVEAALLTPVLLLIVFGIIEFGFVFKDWLAVTSSVRAGARMASAEPRAASFSQDAANQVAKEGAALRFTSSTVLWVYKAGANGYPVGKTDFSSCPSTSCVKFTWSGTAFVKQSGSDWAATSQNACQGDTNHDSVGVYLAVNDPGITKLFFSTIKLSSRTVMSLEPIPFTDANGCK